MVTTFAASMPKSTSTSRRKVRTNKPAPVKRTSASAISETTRALRRRRRPDSVVVLTLPSLSDSFKLIFDAVSDGARPKTMPVATVITRLNISTRQSRAITLALGRLNW